MCRTTLKVDYVSHLSKERYYADQATGIRFCPSLPSSMLEITDSKMSEWVQERLTLHPYSTYEDPPPHGTPESASIPRTYIHCTLGPLSSWMEPFAERTRKLGWNLHTMSAGHDVMITHPNELAEILFESPMGNVIIIHTILYKTNFQFSRFFFQILLLDMWIHPIINLKFWFWIQMNSIQIQLAHLLFKLHSLELTRHSFSEKVASSCICSRLSAIYQLLIEPLLSPRQ